MMHEGARQLLLAGAGLFLIGALIMGRWLMHDLPAQERFDTRIRQIHGEEIRFDGMVDQVAYRDSVARSISQVGQKILASGIVAVLPAG